jgi:outer membrane protein OmpA-like peptidoglycan-associated protein
VPLAAAVVVVPTVLAGLTLLWPRPQIEDRLTADATAALAAAGLAPDEVVFSGRDATLSGLTGPDADRGVEVVEGVPGVRVAELAVSGDGTGGPVGGDGTGGAGAVAPGAVGIALRGADLVLSGERAAVVGAATEQADGRTVVDELTVVPGAALPGGLDAAALGAAAGAVAEAVAGAGVEDLSATVETGADGAPVVALTGSVPDDAAAAAVRQALDAAVPGATVDDRLTVAAAGAGAAPDAGAAPGAGTAPDAGAGGGDLDDAAKAALQGRIDALLAGTPVVFAPDSPELTPEGTAALDRVLPLVAAAPGARLQIDGYVATGRGSGRLTAQELSDRRAATVREALVAGGVPADRVTARGLGEGDAPAAEAAGRRVEISVV